MCIVSFHLQQHPKYKFVVVANRDEFYKRPTKEIHYWKDHPHILAGRDLKANGTWLGMTKDGRFAALTNFRDPQEMNPDKRSRGDIVTNFLNSSLSSVEYLQQLHTRKDEYNGFNVLVGTPDELYFYNNKQGEITKVEPGTHSLSNHMLNTPWPKVRKARERLSEYVNSTSELDTDQLFLQLSDDELAPDNELPDTGIGYEFEKKVSSIFIRTDDYGTRSSTVILVTHENDVIFTERTFNDGSFKKQETFTFHIGSR